MFNKIDDISPIYRNMENVTKNRHHYNFSIFCQTYENRKFNRLNVNFLVFLCLIKSGKIIIKKTRKWPQVYSILAFFQLIRKTEKWKMDKNIAFSHKQDFSNFRFIFKLEKWKNDAFLLALC